MEELKERMHNVARARNEANRGTHIFKGLAIMALSVSMLLVGSFLIKTYKLLPDADALSEEDTGYEEDTSEDIEYEEEEDDSLEASADGLGDEDRFEALLALDADEYDFTKKDLKGLSAQELTYLRNGIYAAHGYVFKSSELNEFFNQYDWYEQDDEVTEVKLTKREKKNAKFIADYQKKHHLEYKPK